MRRDGSTSLEQKFVFRTKLQGLPNLSAQQSKAREQLQHLDAQKMAYHFLLQVFGQSGEIKSLSVRKALAAADSWQYFATLTLEQRKTFVKQVKDILSIRQ